MTRPSATGMRTSKRDRRGNEETEETVWPRSCGACERVDWLLPVRDQRRYATGSSSAGIWLEQRRKLGGFVYDVVYSYEGQEADSG